MAQQGSKREEFQSEEVSDAIDLAKQLGQAVTGDWGAYLAPAAMLLLARELKWLRQHLEEQR